MVSTFFPGSDGQKARDWLESYLVYAGQSTSRRVTTPSGKPKDIVELRHESYRHALAALTPLARRLALTSRRVTRSAKARGIPVKGAAIERELIEGVRRNTQLNARLGRRLPTQWASDTTVLSKEDRAFLRDIVDKVSSATYQYRKHFSGGLSMHDKWLGKVAQIANNPRGSRKEVYSHLVGALSLPASNARILGQRLRDHQASNAEGVEARRRQQQIIGRLEAIQRLIPSSPGQIDAVLASKLLRIMKLIKIPKTFPGWLNISAAISRAYDYLRDVKGKGMNARDYKSMMGEFANAIGRAKSELG
jgi:hypothetical protein